MPAAPGKPNLEPRPAPTKTRRVVEVCMAVGVPMALLFGGAGTWAWPAAWVYLALLLAGMMAGMVVFAKFQPGLVEERRRHWRDGKRWDKPLLLIIGVVGPVAIQLVCGLDRRHGWSSPVPVGVQLSAAAAMAVGIAIAAAAMAVNPFFSATVRIQSDRGHTVVATGPYRYVRHPGYAGMLLVTLGGPVLLGTLWGLVPAGLLAAIFMLRTALEDRTLRAELAGYSDYASRVPSRLLPGIW